MNDFLIDDDAADMSDKQYFAETARNTVRWGRPAVSEWRENYALDRAQRKAQEEKSAEGKCVFCSKMIEADGDIDASNLKWRIRSNACLKCWASF